MSKGHGPRRVKEPGVVERIGVVGGGASGALAAIHLLRRASAPVEISVFEPAAQLGAGVAYGTPDPRHLLNVRAGAMSALPEDPGHFQRWAGSDPDDYRPRQDYAAYLRDLLGQSAAGSPARLRHVRALIADIVRVDDGYVLRSSSGEPHAMDAVILATGHEPTGLPPQIEVDAAAVPHVVADPWRAPIQSPSGGSFAVIGSGLTAVDVALTTLTDDGDARLVMISRHGLLPASHDDPWLAPWATPMVTPDELLDGRTLRDVVHTLRHAGPTWRQAVDSIRPVTQQVWHALTLDQRRQFLRHAERYWEVHRHRMPPEVARRIARWRREGRLDVVRADIVRIGESSGEAVIHAHDGRAWRARTVVAATGLTSVVRGDALLARLVDRAVLRAEPLGMGIDCDIDSMQARNGEGEPLARFHVIGPATKGVLWESTAVPDIRNAASKIASLLTRT